MENETFFMCTGIVCMVMIAILIITFYAIRYTAKHATCDNCRNQDECNNINSVLPEEEGYCRGWQAKRQ